MNDQTIGVGQNTKLLMDKALAEDASNKQFTHAERMALVADGLMDPKEVGVTTAEEAKLQIMPEPEPPAAQFGSELVLRCGVVPLKLQAEWAYGENKIVLHGTDKDRWIEDWIEKNKDKFRMQGMFVCGRVQANFERTFRDPVIGFAQLLKFCGEMIEAKYAGEPSPPATDRTPAEPTNATAEPKE